MTRNRRDDESPENSQSGPSSGDADLVPDDQSDETESGPRQAGDDTAGSTGTDCSFDEEDDEVVQDGPSNGERQVTGDSDLRDQLCDEIREVNHAVSTASTGSDHLVAALRILEADDRDATRQELRAAEATLREASETLLAVATRISDDGGESDDHETDGDDESDGGSASRVINTGPDQPE